MDTIIKNKSERRNKRHFRNTAFLSTFVSSLFEFVVLREKNIAGTVRPQLSTSVSFCYLPKLCQSLTFIRSMWASLLSHARSHILSQIRQSRETRKYSNDIHCRIGIFHLYRELRDAIPALADV